MRKSEDITLLHFIATQKHTRTKRWRKATRCARRGQGLDDTAGPTADQADADKAEKNCGAKAMASHFFLKLFGEQEDTEDTAFASIARGHKVRKPG